MKQSKNRFDQFFAIINENHREIFFLSLLVFLFAIPYFAFKFIESILNTAFLEEIVNATEEEQIILVNDFQSRQVIFAFIGGALISLAFLAIVSCMKIFKKVIYHDVKSIKSEFFSNLKKDIIKNILTGFVFGILIEFMMIGNFFDGNILYEIIGLLIIDLIIVFFAYFTLLDIYYSDNFFNRVFNALMLVIVRLPINLLVSLLSLCFVALFFFVDGLTATTIVYSYLGLFGFGLIILALQITVVSAFDKYINKNNYPNIYKKGLFIDGQEN